MCASATSEVDSTQAQVTSARQRLLELNQQIQSGKVTPELIADLENAYDEYVRVRTKPITGSSWLSRLVRNLSS